MKTLKFEEMYFNNYLDFSKMAYSSYTIQSVISITKPKMVIR